MQLTAEYARAIAVMLETLNSVEIPSSDVFLDGKVAVMHRDGFRIGYVYPEDCGWLFEIDYAEPKGE